MRTIHKNWNPDVTYKVKCRETGMVFEDSRYAAEWVISQKLSKDSRGNVATRIRKACRKEKHFDRFPIYQHYWDFVQEEDNK